MRKLFLLGLTMLSVCAFGQDIKATTESGKKVILKSNNTWEYDSNTTTNENDCFLDANYKEPKGMNSMTLRMINGTTDDLKKHVAVENECEIKDIKLLNISEQKGNGMYSLCVKGRKMKYRRTGSVFSRLDEDILKPKN